MLHEEESQQSVFGVTGTTRKKFTRADLGMVTSYGFTFWRELIVNSLESNEDYHLLFNEQVCVSFELDRHMHVGTILF